jgi:hypothetical protein
MARNMHFTSEYIVALPLSRRAKLGDSARSRMPIILDSEHVYRLFKISSFLNK